MTGKIAVSHVGICVSDMERSLRFYRDGLGFVEGSGLDLDNECGNVMGLKDFFLSTRPLTLGGATITLLHFRRSQNAHVATRLREMNHTGLTQLALVVDDVDEVAERITAHGGMVFPDTRTSFERSSVLTTVLYCSDPDFTRIEIYNVKPLPPLPA